MHFTSFCKRGFTIADPLYTDIPGNFYILTDGSLVCTKHPAKKSGVAIGPLAVGGGGLAGIRRRSRPGNGVESRVSSPRAWGSRSWGGEHAGVGNRRRSTVVAAAARAPARMRLGVDNKRARSVK
jgi:hypothetical protein